MAGTLPARVTSTTANDIYAHIDKDGRYRVNLDFDREAWKPGYESLWVRQSRPYAGDTYGLHLPLLAGTEVSIAFEGGNPDRPYIAGVKHDSAHPDHVTIQNYRRNVLRTPANNKLRLDDERGKEHIKISTEYGGKSQLNLGHLVDAGKQQRGEGFELRTDMWGAIRAKKGIFISADGQERAQGQVREMAAALGILSGAQSQMASLSADAETANADPADLASQVTLLEERVKELTQAVVLLSGPKGVTLASGEYMQLAAARSLEMNAGNNADIGVMKNLFIGVGQALSVFVRKAGIKLFANKGAISLQAQNDLMELLAKKSIEITSTEDEITNPIPTYEQVWNWKKNIDGGSDLYIQKRKNAQNYLGKDGRTYTEEQLQHETISRWNGGAYHEWNESEQQWQRKSNILCDSQTGNIGWDTTNPSNQDRTEEELHDRDHEQYSMGGAGQDDEHPWRYSGVCYADHVID